MKILVTLVLLSYVGLASAQPRCVKWTWFNAGKAQKTVCQQWSKG